MEDLPIGSEITLKVVERNSCNGCSWNQCIPYIGNESLLGTTKDVEG